MKRPAILVTGSCGYVGSMLTGALSDAFDVIAYDIARGDDITDADAVRRAAAGADIIVHMAAIVGYPACEAQPHMARQVNVDGAANIVSCGKPIIYTSPMAGFAADLVTEDMEIEPSSVHASTKREAEHIVRASGDYKILRLGSNYGVSPNMRDDLLVHTMAREGLGGRIRLYDPDSRRALVSLRDVVRAIRFFCDNMDTPSGTYNVVTEAPRKCIIASLIRTMVGCDIDNVEGGDPESRNYSVSTKKIEGHGFDFLYPLESELPEILEYYRSLLS